MPYAIILLVVLATCVLLIPIISDNSRPNKDRLVAGLSLLAVAISMDIFHAKQQLQRSVELLQVENTSLTNMLHTCYAFPTGGYKPVPLPDEYEVPEASDESANLGEANLGNHVVSNIPPGVDVDLLRKLRPDLNLGNSGLGQASDPVTYSSRNNMNNVQAK